MSQVSSRGCSRAYILCVLFRGLKYVQNLRCMAQSVSFPFHVSAVEDWLEKAKGDCGDVEFQKIYGGTDFNPADSSTFWTSASHFFTWWKNNIERKSKFQSLLNDSNYSGSDTKCVMRSMYCKQAIALAINIKNHFDRVLNQQVDRTRILQILLPCKMPHHLEAWCECNSDCNNCIEPQSIPSQITKSNDTQNKFPSSGSMDEIDFEDFHRTHLEKEKVRKSKPASIRTGCPKRRRLDNDECSYPGKVKRWDSEDYSPMECMHQAVGLQHARRALRNCKDVELHDLSSSIDFDEAGSALLLELKENNKGSRDEDGENIEEIGALQPAGKLNSHLDAFDSVSLKSSHHDAKSSTESFICRIRRDELHITTSPYAYDQSDSPDLQSGPDTPNGSMHELLFACYRDGIYPSPVMPFATSGVVLNELFQVNSCAFVPRGVKPEHSYGYSRTETPYRGTGLDADDEATATDSSSSTNTCSESKDSSFQQPAAELVKGTVMTESSPQTTTSLATVDQLSATRSLDSPHVQQVDLPAIFAYDELQLLLTHLLGETRE